nr:MAG TPA: hypothetical protein [Caudoviricetes sp.]
MRIKNKPKKALKSLLMPFLLCYNSNIKKMQIR